jgi:hypothetical protein
VFYVVAALLLGFAIWAFSHSADIISEAIETGQITLMGNLYDIIGFYMANTGQYFVFAILIAGIGMLLGKKERVTSGTRLNNNDYAKTQNDAELDEWFGSENNKEDDE